MIPVIRLDDHRRRLIGTLLDQCAPGVLPPDALARHLQALQLLALTRPQFTQALLSVTDRLAHAGDAARIEKGGA